MKRRNLFREAALRRPGLTASPVFERAMTTLPSDRGTVILYGSHVNPNGSVSGRSCLDVEEVLAAARETRLLVTVEDHFARGGLASAVAELLVERGIRARLHTISMGARWFAPASLSDVLRREGMTGDAIARRVLDALGAATDVRPEEATR